MKKLSDYKDEEAIDLWADLLEPLTEIFGDPEVAKIMRSGKPIFIIARNLLKCHPNDVKKMLLRIDPTPIDGFNLIVRLVELLREVDQNEDLKSFFGFAGRAKTENVFSGSATENTGADEK